MKKIYALTVLTALIATPAQALEVRPYLGVFGGYHYLDTESPEVDKHGYSVGGKGILSLESRSWFFDFAGGYEYEKLYGDQNSGRDLRNDSLLGEFDMRLKVSDGFSIGPVATYHWNADHRRSKTPELNKTDMWLGGAKLMFQNYNSNTRLEISLQKSLQGLDHRDLYVANIGLHFGFPWQSRKAEAQEYTPSPSESEPMIYHHEPIREPVAIIESETTSITSETAAVTPPADLVLTIQGSATTKFQSGQSQVAPAHQKRLRALGAYLAHHPEQYQVIHIEGHSDSRGSAELNQDLSERRADSVKNILVNAGVPEEQVISQGFGEEQPLDQGENEIAWAKNRRTEIKFYGIKPQDKDQLNLEFNRIMAGE